jgi:hypothetical protein
VPDHFGFDHFDTGTRPELRCIVCRAGGPPWQWRVERREQHHRAHQGDVDDQAAEAAIERVTAELRTSPSTRRDRRVIHPTRICENSFCATVFQPRKSTARYCSTACRVAVHRMRHRDDPGGEASSP